MLRFHLDESVHGAVAGGLTRLGFDLTTSFQASLLGASDSEQLAFALREGRVLVTQDRDFLRLSTQQIEHPGIAYWPANRRSIGIIIDSLEILGRSCIIEEMRGQVIFI